MKPRRALVLIDFFNPLDFRGLTSLAGPAVRAARNTSKLKARLRRLGVPAVYANDNFGQWDSEFSMLVSRCAALPGASGEIARLLAPQEGDRAILKPRHSAFYGTALEFLLEELRTELLILTGTSTDSCISITAHDAHMRKFKLWIPSDCVASPKAEYSRAALAHLKRVTDASVVPSRRGSAPQRKS